MLIRLRPIGLYRFVFGSNAQMISDSEVLSRLIRGDNFIRWGDGETANLRGKSTWHQTGNEELSRKLSQLLDYCSEGDEILFGINFQAIRNSLFNRTIWNFGILQHLLLSSRALFNHRRFYPYFKHGIADALFFYHHSKDLPDYLRLIAPFERPILVITSNPEALSLLKDWSAVSFIEISPRNAFDGYLKMVHSAENWIQSLSIPKDGLILLAGGSTSKILILEFSKQCQVIDIGSGFAFAKQDNWVMDWDK